MPIGNMMAINMASPLMLTAAGALFLREPVGWRRWSAVLLGFFGVLLMVQPSAAGFNIYALLGVLAVACLVARDMVTRGIDRSIPSLIVILANMATMTVGSLAVATVEGWASIGWRETLLLAGSAALIAGGAQCLVIAFREGTLSMVAPLRYTALLWALLFGFLLWGDVPSVLAWTGILLIVISGLYVWYRERNPA
jgi:drug/metabolite transporter (DMT)-like permease